MDANIPHMPDGWRERILQSFGRAGFSLDEVINLPKLSAVFAKLDSRLSPNVLEKLYQAAKTQNIQTLGPFLQWLLTTAEDDGTKKTAGIRIDLPEHRGITLPQLRGLVASAHLRFSSDSIDLYNLVSEVVKPATAARRCSYIELVALGAQIPSWFVSHFWGIAMNELLACLAAQARARNLADGSSWWIFAFAHNHWASSASNDSVRKAMTVTLGTLVVVDRVGVIFQRAWCCYELSLGLQETESKKLCDFVSVANPESEELTAILVADGATAEDEAKGSEPDWLQRGGPAGYKSFRERDFPTALIEKAMSVQTAASETSQPEDKLWLLAGPGDWDTRLRWRFASAFHGVLAAKNECGLQTLQAACLMSKMAESFRVAGSKLSDCSSLKIAAGLYARALQLHLKLGTESETPAVANIYAEIAAVTLLLKAARPLSSSPEDRRVLITGATGLLGREVMKVFKAAGWTTRGLAYRRAQGEILKCDLCNAAAVKMQFQDFGPDVVIHCAAERRPDRLEGDTAYAIKINVQATRFIGEAALETGAWVIYLSTNYVFDGKEAPYAEDARPCPLNVYGDSKLAGEIEIIDSNPNAAIVRVPLLYGPVESLDETSVTVLLSTVKGDAPKLDNWQERFPTSTEDLALVLEAFAAALQQRGQSNPSAFRGIFHWQANARHTKYTMGKAIAEIAGLDSSKLISVDTPPAPGSAPRPQFERMLCSRIEKVLGIEGQAGIYRSDFKEGLGRHLQPFL